VDTLEQVILSNAVVATGLAILAGTVGLICRRPALVHALWLLVLIKLVTPPIWPVRVFQWPAGSVNKPIDKDSNLPAPPTEKQAEEEYAWKEGNPKDGNEDDMAVSQPITLPFPPRPDSLDLDSRPVAMTWNWSLLEPLVWSVWLSGSLGWLLVAGIRMVRFQRMLRFAAPASSALQERVQLLAECLGLAKAPSVYLTPGAISPMIWPLGLRPRLLLPLGLLDRLSLDQQDTILLHELAHLHRRDHWVRALELLATGIYWWHPIVWWGRQALRDAEEQCCDAWVMWALPASRRAYASALMETLDFLAGARPALLPPVACGLGQFQTLKRRLTMILTGTTPHALSRLGFLAVLGLGFLLPVVPTWGQDNDDEKQIDKKDVIKKDILKKLKDEAIKNIDVDDIKKEVRDALDKELKVELGDLGSLKIDLDLDLEDLLDNLNFDEKDGPTSKEMNRARAEIQKAQAQIKRAKAQIEFYSQVLQKAQDRLAQLEKGRKDVDNVKVLKDVKEWTEKAKDKATDKAEWLEKAAKEKPDRASGEFSKRRPKDGASKDDDLEKRFDRMMREMEELGRELRRRRSEDKSAPDRPQKF
jgi:bla regulator protein blaR1